ncbi:MAG: F0F1 ATP synthase subunit A [Vulcanimicrobiaceae bacterium]
MNERIGYHSLWTLPIVGKVHADTILTTWLAMAVALVLLAWVARGYRSHRVQRAQTVFEGVVDYVSDLVYSALGKDGERFVPFFIALFVLIFLLNQFGMFPFGPLGLPFGGSPTADLNTTVAYALIVFFLIHTVAIRKRGVKKAYAHLFKPLMLTPITILEELVRPVTLAARLFFNIFVGELLFIIVASIIRARIFVGPFDLSLAASIVPFFIQFFNFFVGTIQAFIFTLLGIVYLSLATADDH